MTGPRAPKLHSQSLVIVNLLLSYKLLHSSLHKIKTYQSLQNRVSIEESLCAID
jgi:hypothetical protein